MVSQERINDEIGARDSYRAGGLSRGLHLALFATAMAWAAAGEAIASRSARGIAVRFQLGALRPLLESLFLLFLVTVGLRMLDWIATRGRYDGEVLPVPRRAGWRTEWAVGAAIGWGLCLAATLPVLLSGNLHGHWRWAGGSAGATVLGLATLLVAALAQEAIFRGYALRRLMNGVGESWGLVLMSVGFGVVLVQTNPPSHFLIAVVDGTLLGMLLAMAWMRTHALWLGWGLHFAYRAVAALVLGLPIAGRGEFGALAETYSSGPRWLSGGAFGLDAALPTALVMLVGMVVLYRATREYAWRYTHAPIVAAAYEVVVPPPTAHVAMEKAAAAPPPLVQILPSTPRGNEGLEPIAAERLE